MENPTNMRIDMSRLAFKTEERWRNVAYDIKQQRGRRARFADLVSFIDRQAKIATYPFFRNLNDKGVVPKLERYKDTVKYTESGVKGSSFATQVSAEKILHIPSKQVSPSKPTTVTAFKSPCLFCQNNLALA